MRADLRPLAVALVVLAAPVVAARAEPAADPAAVKALVAKIDAARAAQDDSALASALKEIPPLYKGTEDASLRESLRKEIGASLKNAKLPGARGAALSALAETEDGAKAWSVLQPVFPGPEREDEDGFHLEVVNVTGALHPEPAVPPLVELIKKAKKPELAAAATTALGEYHASKHRVAHLEEFVKAVKLVVPGRSTTKAVSPEAQQRWAAVGPAFGKAMDKLTGQVIGDPLEWIKKFDDTKDLKSLFKD
jgi:hypothetical protein